MSRVKRSAGKEYRRLSQSPESDDEVILYTLSPSSPPAPFRPRSAATTEFGNGHYDKSRDLELLAPPRRERRRKQAAARTRKHRVKFADVRWGFSRESKACACFLLILATAVVILVVAWSQFDVSTGGKVSQLPSSQLQSSASVSTAVSVAPTPLPHAGGEDASDTVPETTHLPPAEHTITPSITGGGGEVDEVTTETTSHANIPLTTAATVIDSAGLHSILTPSLSTSSPEAPEVSPTSSPYAPPTSSPEAPPTSSPEAPPTSSPEAPPTSSPEAAPTSSPEAPPTSSPEAPPTSSPEAAPTSSPEAAPTSSLGTPEEGEGARSISWQREFSPGITETALQLRDMNGDGVSDVVMMEGLGSCDMVVHALDGLTGNTVWSVRTTYDAFAVKCDVDLNGDDIIDCIAAGRQSGFRALSGADGTTIWDRDPRLVYLRYNFYFPLFVPDVDGDGVQDIITTHGGDSTYSDEDTQRSPAFLVAVSGRTGEQLMERVPLPDGHETYMSPVRLVSRGAAGDVILVGTGGETLPGSLWAISYDSLLTRIYNYLYGTGQTSFNYTIFTDYVNHPCANDMLQSELESLRPVFDPDSFDKNRDTHSDSHLSVCPSWDNHEPVWNVYGLCIYQLLSCNEKGVMLPPVIVDMTGDLQDDLVVSAFEGKTLVINGETGEVVWEVTRPGTESYSVPAPLMYNNDTIPDLLVRINYGVWADYYNHSTIAILDGQNGDTLWSLDSMRTGMMSSLSLAAEHSGNDAAVFIAIGTMDGENPVIREARHAVVHPHCLVSGEGCWEGEEEEGRERRHSEQVEVDTVESESSGDSDYGDDIMMTSYSDPAGLWEGVGDVFPDPVTNLSAFLTYCGWSEQELTASVYVLSRHQSTTPVPLFSHGPIIYIPGTQKRHSGSHTGGDAPNDITGDITQLSPEAIQELRCSHILRPDMIVSTPAIGDVNNDGRLEIAYTVSWSGPNSNDIPPQFAIYIATLEDRVMEVYGEEGLAWMTTLLPATQQPWTRYMGTSGDNVYHTPPHE